MDSHTHMFYIVDMTTDTDLKSELLFARLDDDRKVAIAVWDDDQIQKCLIGDEYWDDENSVDINDESATEGQTQAAKDLAATFSNLAEIRIPGDMSKILVTTMTGIGVRR